MQLQKLSIQEQEKKSLKRTRLDNSLLVFGDPHRVDQIDIRLQKRQKRFSEPPLSKTLSSKHNQGKSTQLTLRQSQLLKGDQVAPKQLNRTQLIKKQTTLTSMRKVSILKHLQKSSQRISSPFKPNSQIHQEKLSSAGVIQTRSTAESTTFKGTSLSTVTPCSVFDNEQDFYQSIQKNINQTTSFNQPESVSWTGAIAKNSISRCYPKQISLHPKWTSLKKPGLSISLKLPLNKSTLLQNNSSSSSSSSCSCNQPLTNPLNNLLTSSETLLNSKTHICRHSKLLHSDLKCQIQLQKSQQCSSNPLLKLNTENTKRINTRKRVLQSAESSSAWRCNKKADLQNYPDDYHADIHSVNILSCDREILENSNVKHLSIRDLAAYGHYWLVYELQREAEFHPVWQFSLKGEAENLRLQIISLYWESVKLHPLSASTIYSAVHTLNRLINTWPEADQNSVKSHQWPFAAVTAFRLACKFEEKPEVFWGITNFWELFPIFKQWSIDKSELQLNKAEMDVLQLLNHKINLPVASTFVLLYLNGGGWPPKAAEFYCNLALYMLSLCTLASTKDVYLKKVTPSKLAAAAVVLAIKIINGDRGLVSGMLAHLATCDRIKSKSKGFGPCSCCLEYFPERFQIYTNYQYSDIQPVIRGLSSLLRTKPEQAYSLRHFFPLWAEHDWQ